MWDQLRSALVLASALASALAAGINDARAFDDSRYPDFTGQWRPIGGPMRFDPTKGWGEAQQPPLTPEYQTIFQANLDDQAAGGQGTTPTFTCISPGMPRVANGYGQMEVVITPETTHILVQHIHDNRRIFTDGRDFPREIEPSLIGYSIGKWLDTTGSGHFDVLAVETRGFKGPRAFDSSGIPLHSDNESIVKERIYLDAADRNVFHDDLTVIDHALTRPWSVAKRYRRETEAQPYWREVSCTENNNHLEIGKQAYMLSADGFLMPTKKDQPPPDLRYFKPAQR
jgi:hypothetical protein